MLYYALTHCSETDDSELYIPIVGFFPSLLVCPFVWWTSSDCPNDPSNRSRNGNQYHIPLLKTCFSCVPMSVRVVPFTQLLKPKIWKLIVLVFPFSSDTASHHALQRVPPKFYPHPCYCCSSSETHHPWLGGLFSLQAHLFASTLVQILSFSKAKVILLKCRSDRVALLLKSSWVSLCRQEKTQGLSWSGSCSSF